MNIICRDCGWTGTSTMVAIKCPECGKTNTQEWVEKTEQICKKCGTYLEMWYKDYQFTHAELIFRNYTFIITYCDIYGCPKCKAKHIKVIKSEALQKLE